MTDNIVSFPGTEDTPAAILRNALHEAEDMDAVIIFTIMKDGEIDLSASGVKVSDLCIASARLQSHTARAVEAVEDMCDDGV